MTAATNPMRIGIAGIRGRMGQMLVLAAADDPEVTIVGGTARSCATDVLPAGAPRVYERLGDLIREIEVLIDFTEPSPSVAHARACAEAGCPIVIGTTSLSEAQLDELRQLSRLIPLFYARNMSVGLNTVLTVLPHLIRALDDCDVEIIETHHRGKVDAPSGTALALAEVVASARADASSRLVHGRQGSCRRQTDEIGIHSVRAGANPGEHTVLLAIQGEEIALVHRALSRMTFAAGALRASKFLVNQPPGYYEMATIIG